LKRSPTSLRTSTRRGLRRRPDQAKGRGISSALGIEEAIVNVWKLREGKCVELRIFTTVEEALEATAGGRWLFEMGATGVFGYP
jgi:hypothetical protein